MKHVILGNGPAGVVAAETLRKAAPGDAITLVGDEPGPPYSRMAIPYLLMGNIDEKGTWLRKDPAHFARLRIALKEGRARASSEAARPSLSAMRRRAKWAGSLRSHVPFSSMLPMRRYGIAMRE